MVPCRRQAGLGHPAANPEAALGTAAKRIPRRRAPFPRGGETQRGAPGGARPSGCESRNYQEVSTVPWYFSSMKAFTSSEW